MALQPYDPATVLNPQAPRQQAPLYPSLSPEDESGLLSRIGSGLLSGVGALGRFLDATFGGRAVRGLLGGHPRELLSPLPLSDSLGLTDPGEFTTGRQLLEKAGVVGAPEPGLDLGDVAGFAADVALDPAMYVNPLGAFNKLGLLAKKTNSVPRGLYAQTAGFTHAAEDLARLPPVAAGALGEKLAVLPTSSVAPRALTEAARASGEELVPRFRPEARAVGQLPVGLPPAPFATGGPLLSQPKTLEEALGLIEEGVRPPVGEYLGAATGANRHTPTGYSGARYQTLDVSGAPQATLTKHLIEDVPTNAATPLAGAFGLHLPFSHRSAVFGTGPTAQAWAAQLERLGGWVGGLPGLRTLNRDFNPELMNRREAEGQQLARDAYRPTERALMPEVRGTGFDLNEQLKPTLEILPAYEGRRLATLAAERQPLPRTASEYVHDLMYRDPQLYQELQGNGKLAQLTDAHLQNAADVGEKLGAYERGLPAGEHALGVPGEELPNYAKRQLVRLPPGQPARAVGAGPRRGLGSSSPFQIQREELFDLPGGQTAVNDLFRARTQAGEPILTGPNSLATDTVAEAMIAAKRFGKPVDQLTAEEYKLVKGLSEYMVGQDSRRALTGLYEVDPVAGAGVRGIQGVQARAGAETTLEAARRYGKPLGDITEPAMPLPEFLQQQKLTWRPAEGSPRVAEQLAAQGLGLEGPEALKGYGLPRRIAEDLQAGSAGRGSQNWYDKTLNLYRTWLYGAWPAGQARNTLWGIVSNWRQGLGPVEQWRAFQDAKRAVGLGQGEIAPLPGMAAGLSAEEVRQGVRREAYSQNAALTQATRQRFGLENAPTPDSFEALKASLPPELADQSLLGALGSGLKRATRPAEGQSWGQALDPFNVPGVRDALRGPGGGQSWIREMHNLGASNEDLLRLTNFIGLRRKGFTPEAAAASSNQYHFLYNDLTDFERTVGRRVALFPTFSARNLPLLAQELATEPGKLAAGVRASTGLRSEGDFVPPYLAESTAIPLGGPSEEGMQRYLSGFGFGYEDEPVRAAGSLLSGDFKRAFGQAGSMLNPFFKYPLEVATGTQLHTGRRLEDLRPGTTVGALVPEEQAGPIAQLLANSPASRAITSLDQSLDERKGLLPKVANLLTGLRFTDVDLARQKEIATRQIVEEALRGKAGFGNYERLYVKPEKIGNLNPDELALYSLYRQIEKEAIQAAKARKATQGLPLGAPVP